MVRVHASINVNGVRYTGSIFTTAAKWADASLKKKFKQQLAKNLVQSILEDFDPTYRVVFESDMSAVTPDPV